MTRDPQSLASLDAVKAMGAGLANNAMDMLSISLKASHGAVTKAAALKTA